MNRGWYNYSMEHKLASKGIKTKIPFKGVYSKGMNKIEFVEFDKLPKYLYHATPTENVINILEKGLDVGKEETRSLEYEWDSYRPVDNTIFFVDKPKLAGYFGFQAVQSVAKRKGEEFTADKLDYTILRINTKEFEKHNFVTYLGAELFGKGDREYFVKYKVPRFWIDGGTRIYYDIKKADVITETYDIKWDRTKFELIPKKVKK